MKDLSPEKIVAKRYAVAERFTEGSPLSSQQYLSIINELGLNQINSAQVMLRLSLLDCYFRLFPKEPIDVRLKVWYGFAKLTKKIVRKPSVVVFYENGKSRTNEKFIKQKMHVVYERFQTEEESKDADFCNRLFTKTEYFINEKPWHGNIEGIIHNNFVAEKNNVSEDERTHIAELLRKEAYRFYGIKIPKIYQSSFNF